MHDTMQSCMLSAPGKRLFSAAESLSEAVRS